MRKEIRSEFIVNANADKIWNVLIDFSHYREWNPFLIFVKGKIRAGSPLKIRAMFGNGSTMTFKPIVQKVLPASELRWKATVLKETLFSGEHYLILESLGFGKTKVIHGEIFSGLLSGLAFMLLENKLRDGINLMNKRLAYRAQ
jgi:hypothetical protein